MGSWNNTPVNIVSDSLYVVGVVQRTEDALLRETKNQHLGEMFIQLHSTLRQRKHEFCIMHIISHQWTVGLGKGNARAEEAVSCLAITPPTNKFEEACNSHKMLHQNAKSLH